MTALLNNLILGHQYDRKAVHDLFEPETKFTPQAGSWGLHGIVKLKPTHVSGSRKSYVFFVTYGKSQGEHHFKEGITSEGVLTWQSQPRQDLQNLVIRDFISHNPQQDSIYLFLRPHGGAPYHYLGRLGYLSHDPSREKPVYFQWQLLDWDDELGDIVAHILPRNSSGSSYKIPKPTPSTLKQPDKRYAFPIVRHSFTWYSETVMVKELDKSAFLHHGTAIPKAMIDYWSNSKESTFNQPVELIYSNSKHDARIEKDDHGRFRLFWHTDFEKLIIEYFQNRYHLYSLNLKPSNKSEIRFEKLGEKSYKVEFIDDEIIDRDNDLISSEDQTQYQDGKAIKYYGSRYERNPNNRKLAIKFHGTTCSVCGFDFGKFYGSLGQGFIEIHHINPLYLNEDETLIDPATDLLPLCSNCHRMIHRDRSKLMTVQELKEKLR